MSFEKHLKEAFKEHTVNITPPVELDNRILSNYNGVVMKKRRNAVMFKNKRWSRLAIVALLVVILSGFMYGATQLFSQSTSKVTYNAFSSQTFNLSEQNYQNIRDQLFEVKSQLNEGETAIVYTPEAFKDFPLHAVANFKEIKDWNEWSSLLAKAPTDIDVTADLLNGQFNFKAGLEDYPFGPKFEYVEDLDEFEAEKRAKSDNSPVWRLSNADEVDFVTIYTTVYEDEAGAMLYYTWQIYDESVKGVSSFSSPDSPSETIDINGVERLYLQNNQSFLAENGVLNTLSWLEEQDGHTIMKSLESDSPSITKDTLVEVAGSL